MVSRISGDHYRVWFWVRVLVGALLVGAVAGVVVRVLTTTPDSTPPPLPASQYSLVPEEPTDSDGGLEVSGPAQLVISSVGVKADLVSVGSDGDQLVIPGDASMVGVWDGGGALDGGSGTVLLAGHVQTVDVARGALWGLADVAAGDVVETSDWGGNVTRWVASEMRVTAKDLVPPEIFNPSGPRVLAVVTCGGEHQAFNVILIAVPLDSLKG